MTKPINIPNVFASATSAIPLSQLDQDFSTLANATNDLATYSNYVADTGAANSFITNYPSNTNTNSLTTGLRLQFKAANANSGASTLNVQVNGASIGTAAIRLTDGSALPANTIIAGALVDVMYDGTNFQLMNDPSGGQEVITNLTLSGNLTVTGTSNFTGNVTANVANTTTSTITNLSSGNVTITGGTISNVTLDNVTVDVETLSNVTINGGVINNVSSISTTGSLTFTGTGNRITGDFGNATQANRVLFQSSTTNGPTSVGAIPNGTSVTTNFAAYSSSSDPANSSIARLGMNGTQDTRLESGITGTGTYLPLTMYTGGSERLRIDTSGNVGIGINNGGAYGKLGVGGTSYQAMFAQSTDSSGAIGILAANSSSEVRMGAVSAHPLALYTSNIERMRIDSSGNVGIGTSSPTSGSKLDVNGQIVAQNGTTSSLGFAFRGATNAGLYINDDGVGNNLVLQANGNNNQLYLQRTGNVGIGTSSPAAVLNCVNASYDGYGQILLSDGATNSTTKRSGINQAHYTNSEEPFTIIGGASTSTDNIVRIGGNDATATLNASTRIVFYTATNNTTTASSASERMRITSGGAVCINSTASSFNLRSSGVASAHFGDAYDASNTGTVQITRPANQGDNKFHLSFIRFDSKVAGIGFLNNSSTFAIQNADNNAGAGVTLTNGATSWGTTSDERKKDIIAPVENAISKLSDWRSVYYKYKTDKESDPQRVGLIAQDVQATLPEAISVEEDEIESLQLRYTETIPILVKAIQEQQAMIETLKAEVALLKSK